MSMPASSSTSTTDRCPFREARCSGVCFLVLQLSRLGWALSKSLTTSRRPYSAARSSGVSNLLFLMVGSVSSSSSSRTTCEWPYWAAQCSGVSLSLFCRVQINVWEVAQENDNIDSENSTGIIKKNRRAGTWHESCLLMKIRWFSGVTMSVNQWAKSPPQEEVMKSTNRGGAWGGISGKVRKALAWVEDWQTCMD